MKIRTADRKLIEKETHDAARKARNEYARNWRANNRDKVKQYNANYWARRAEREKSVILS